MATVLSKGTLFPPELTNEMFNLVRGKSSLARLSGQSPIPFSGQTSWSFDLDNEVDIVAENGAKSNGGATLGQKTITPVKIEYGLRVSDEFMYAADEIRLQYLRTFGEGFAKKVARGIDIMAMHGVNPRTRLAATATIGTNHFDSQVSQTVTATANNSADIESAVGLVQGAEHEVTGIAAALTVKSNLASLKKGSTSNEPLFPELAWGGSPDAINGVPVDFNSTINFGTTPVDLAIVGNFRDYFRWGFARQIPIKVIEYGNPDNDAVAGDLQGHNQVYLRGEAYVGWGILIPSAFARIIPATTTSGSDSGSDSGSETTGG